MAETPSKLWYLARVNLFKELPAETLERIAKSTHMRNFAKGDYISTPYDDAAARIYFLKKGEVEVYEAAPSGRKIIIDMLQPGDIFGYENIAGAPAERNQFIKARGDVVLCIMPKTDFLALLEERPQLALALIQQLSARLAITESKLRDTALSDIETRVLSELERLHTRYGVGSGGQKVIDRRVTHEELAQLVGAARETVTRALARLATAERVVTDAEGRFVLL